VKIPDEEKSLSLLRVALLPVWFDPGLSYNENVWAEEFLSRGHDVRVFIGASKASRADGRAVAGRFPEERIHKSGRSIQFGATSIPLDLKLKRSLRDFDPDLTLVGAVEHGGPYYLLKQVPRRTRISYGSSLLPHHRNSRLLYTLCKERWIRRTVERADLIYTSTLETRELLREICGGSLGSKPELHGLPVAPIWFTGAPGRLPPEVCALKSEIPRLIVIAGRPVPVKRFDLVVSEILHYLEGRPDCGFVFAGLGDDSCSLEIRKLVEGHSAASRCCLLPLVDTPTLAAIYHVCDATVIGLVSIAVQQAIACGCPVAIPNDRWCAHFVKDGVNAAFYSAPADPAMKDAGALDAQFDFRGLKSALDCLLSGRITRVEVARSMEPFSIQNQMNTMLGLLGLKG
jgi:glycosyltransferase involved in cell wall biosynthesis